MTRMKPLMLNTLQDRSLSQADIERITKIIRRSKLLEPVKYEWRRPCDNRTSATGWNGCDEVGQINYCRTGLSLLRWGWTVAAPLAFDFRDKVVTTGRAGTAIEAARLAEASY